MSIFSKSDRELKLPPRSSQYTLVIDSDDVSQHLNPETFMTNFTVEKPWDALAVNTRYDVWALRSYYCRGDCWRQVNKYARQLGYPQALTHYIGNCQFQVKELTPVTSAFGGAVLYKGVPATCATCCDRWLIATFPQVPTNSFYDGTKGCEHVPFHTRAKLKMFINHEWTMGDVGLEHIIPRTPGVAELVCDYVSSRVRMCRVSSDTRPFLKK